jgi:hypothetical protein
MKYKFEQCFVRIYARLLVVYLVLSEGLLGLFWVFISRSGRLINRVAVVIG